MAVEQKNQYPQTPVPSKAPVQESRELTPPEIHKLAQEKKAIAQKQKQTQRQKEAQEKKELQKRKLEEARKRPRPLLKFYNTELLIPISRTQIIPGNLYVFTYRHYKHVPTPLVFYVGSDPRYSTLEGISLQYLSVAERKRMIAFFRKTELHSPRMIANSMKVKDLRGEQRHIFRRSYTSDSLYHYIQKKMSEKVLFYRRYKYNAITSRIYAVPIEAVDRALEINTPTKPINPRKLEESKRHFGAIINRIKSNY